MLALVWKGFNRSISLPGLFQNPTIAQMAELIMTVEEEPASAILVPIEPVGSEIPFFFVHPVGGSVVCYADIARALGPEYPVYGLQSPSPDAGYEITSIEQMAELLHYDEETRIGALMALRTLTSSIQISMGLFSSIPHLLRATDFHLEKCEKG